MSLVSVILPTYNRAKLLTRSISSVINQTYPHWELIVWDDGSTDNTGEIVKSFNDERIHYFYDSNHGVSYARNRAIEKSQGAYIAFLDSDDQWVEEKLATQVEIMLTNPRIDFLFSDFLNVNIQKNKQKLAFIENARAMQLLNQEKISDHLYLIRSGILEAIATDNFIATDSVILKRAIINRSVIFNEDLRNSNDFELWWRFGLEGVHFAYINQVLLTRYKPAGSLSGHSKTAHENRIRALDLCVNAAKTFGQSELVAYLKPQYRNTWHNMITYYGLQGDIKNMLHAFTQSLKYGFRPGAVRLLLQSIVSAGFYTGKK